MSLTDFGANTIIDAALGIQAMPATVYLALCYTQPDTATSGSTLLEPSDASYARQSIATGSPAWTDSVSGVSTVNSAITFPVATEDWNIVTHWAIVDALTAGNLILWGSFDSGYQILDGQRVSLPVNSIAISLTGQFSTVVI